jgi:hypothetical protein
VSTSLINAGTSTSALLWSAADVRAAVLAHADSAVSTPSGVTSLILIALRDTTAETGTKVLGSWDRSVTVPRAMVVSIDYGGSNDFFYRRLAAGDVVRLYRCASASGNYQSDATSSCLRFNGVWMMTASSLKSGATGFITDVAVERRARYRNGVSISPYQIGVSGDCNSCDSADRRLEVSFYHEG